MSIFFKVRGFLSKIYEEKIINDSFKKKTFVIEDNVNSFEGAPKDNYSFDLIGNNTSLLDSYKVGDFVEVFFNIRCKKYEKEGMEDRFFVSLQAWKLVKYKVENKKDSEAVKFEDTKDADELGNDNIINNNTKEDDDLPF